MVHFLAMLEFTDFMTDYGKWLVMTSMEKILSIYLEGAYPFLAMVRCSLSEVIGMMAKSMVLMQAMSESSILMSAHLYLRLPRLWCHLKNQALSRQMSHREIQSVHLLRNHPSNRPLVLQTVHHQDPQSFPLYGHRINQVLVLLTIPR